VSQIPFIGATTSFIAVNIHAIGGAAPPAVTPLSAEHAALRDRLALACVERLDLKA
jgi:hypothetical protein